jgi:hypothetical protein
MSKREESSGQELELARERQINRNVLHPTRDGIYRAINGWCDEFASALSIGAKLAHGKAILIGSLLCLHCSPI